LRIDVGVEYAVVRVPCNLDAEMPAVAKGEEIRMTKFESRIKSEGRNPNDMSG
jgi:hypothetical protein